MTVSDEVSLPEALNVEKDELGAEPRILVADDEQNITLTIGELLRRRGYKVEMAVSGQEALRYLQETEFDLVLTDLKMEGVDGISILEEVRRRSPLTISIILTGYASLESAIAAIRQGAYDYLVKPCPVEELIRTIQHGLEHRQIQLREMKTRRELERLNAELEQLNLKLRAMNEELAAFSYSVSHDLKAPLRAIDGFSRMLLEDYSGRLDAEGQRLLKVVRTNTQKMGQLIDDLLTFSRVGRHQLMHSSIDMTELATTEIEELQARLAAGALETKIDPMPSVRGDPAMIRQVVANLLSNAVKFSRGAEQPRVEMGGRREGSEHVYYVKDNGVGFDMKYAGKLFGVFERLHNADEFEGTGVGLALVRRILHRHGGRVWAKSDPGKGATFYFSLPVIQGEQS